MNVAAPQLLEHGQIKRMMLPAGWLAGETRENVVGNSSLREFHPPNYEEAKLLFYYRGHDLGNNAAENFRDILQAHEHQLTSAEIRGLEIVIRDKADPEQYTITDARTTSLNGKKILFVEGRSNLLNEHSLAMCIDADWTGRFVQEILFQAPSELYLEHINIVRDSLQTIEWV